MKSANIRHLFFDLDHTLWDYNRNARETLWELYYEFNLMHYGIAPFEDFLRAFLWANGQVWNAFEESNLNQFQLRHKRLELVFEQFQLPFTPIEGFNEAYYQRCCHKVHLVDGAIPLLQALVPHFSMHVITNGFDDTQFHKLEKPGLAPFFKTVTTSEKAGRKKPDPAFFQFALQQAGAKKEESMVIGDGWRTDVAGALALDLPVIWFNSEGEEKSHPGVKEIRHLSELYAILLPNASDRRGPSAVS